MWLVMIVELSRFVVSVDGSDRGTGTTISAICNLGSCVLRVVLRTTESKNLIFSRLGKVF